MRVSAKKMLLCLVCSELSLVVSIILSLASNLPFPVELDKKHRFPSLLQYILCVLYNK